MPGAFDLTLALTLVPLRMDPRGGVLVRGLACRINSYVMVAKTRTMKPDVGGAGIGGGKKRSKSTHSGGMQEMHENMEEDFPRGGDGAYVAPVEVKRLREVGY